MLILSLTLVLYRRFGLNNITNFNINMSEPIQCIIGTNGSGKSSLIYQLTPLPPSPDDFHIDGSKTIIINQNDNLYTLKSTFGPTRHSFKKNDMELNPGGTVTVFKELVKQEFNITPEIHELLIGNEVFHNMSPARRREWFTKLSDINYDYALSVYEKLRERSRDISGALKLAKTRLTTEIANVVSTEEELKLRRDIKLTHSELNLLLERNSPLDNPVRYYVSEQDSKLKELQKLSNTLLRMRCVAPYGVHPYGLDPTAAVERDDWLEPITHGFNSIEKIDEVIYRDSHILTAGEALLNNAVSEHSKVAEKINILIKAGENGIKSLVEKVSNLHKRKLDILAKRKLIIDGLSDPNIINAFDSVYDVIINIVLVIEENSTGRFSSVNLNNLNELLLKYRNNKLVLTSELSKLEAKKLHMETHKTNGKVACPKCNHIWIPGYSDEHLELLVKELIKKEEELVKLELLITNTEKEIEANKEYKSFYTDYIRCTNNWPILKPVWDYISNGNYLRNSPRMIVSILDTLYIDLGYELSARNIELEIVETTALIKSAESIGDANLLDMQSKLNDLTIYVDTKTAELNKLRANLSQYKQYRKQLLDAFKLGNEITKLMAEVEQINTDMIEMLRREVLGHCIKQLQSSLALKETTLNGIDLHKGIIKNLEKQIEELTLEEIASKLLVQKLSPNTGLIGEGMLGFIKLFISQMNSLIKKIWTYKLHILDCGIGNGELDFKFGVLMDTNTIPISDIKLCSNGMKEIINLAFKIIAMRYLNISNSPLVLDEWGGGFDSTHKLSAMAAVKELMETKSYSQLFIVSHDYSQYGSLTNSEVTVLDSRNIAIPDNCNMHVTIEN